MATNLNIKDELIRLAQEVGNHKTKREAVTSALEEYIQRREQLKILSSFGKIEFDPKFNYKRQRKKS